MKILALRGENLASLQSRFEIDFASSRLGDAGLFAITGKTGAGKSTLLDAICLALYGGIPRLQANKKNDAEIGRDDDDNRIKANDVRSILSRGKGEAFAEVDFLANDGTRWCAHWSVRRARSKADGRIQAAEQWLENLNTSQRFAGKKQELQDEIQRLIGLSFEQFRRAVMLPQGEFAAFLKAGGDERAALLERMTGGELYSHLSILAYQRAKTEKAAYTLLHSKLGDVELLSDEAQQALNTEITQLQQQTQGLNTQLTALKQQQAVFADTEKLQQLAATASGAANSAQQQLTAAKPRQQHLVLLQQVQPARSDFTLLQTAQAQLKKLSHALSQTQNELPDKEQLRLDMGAKVNAASATLLKAQQDWKTLEPNLRAALKLEQQLETLQHQQAEQTKEQQRQTQSAHEQEENLRQLLLQQTNCQQRQQQLTAKLQQDQALKTLSEQYAAVRDNLEQYLKAEQEKTRLQTDRQAIQQEQLTHKQQQDSVNKQLAQLTTEKTSCTSQLSHADLTALEQQQSQALASYADKQQSRDALREVTSTLKEWQLVLDQAEKTQLIQSELQHSLSTMQQQLSALLPELKALHIRHDECAQLVQKSREVMQLSDHRAELRPNEACPLCGSAEHPYALDNPLAENLLQTQQQRLTALSDELKRHEAQRIQLEQSIPKEQKQLTTCQQDLAESKQRTSIIYQRYATSVDSLELTNALNAQAGQQLVEQQLNHCETAIAQSTQTLDELQHTNEQRAQQIKTARAAQDQLQQLQTQEAELQRQANTLQQQSTQWQERLHSLNTQDQLQTDILQHRSTALHGQFGGTDWQQALKKQGQSAFLEQLTNSTQQYQADQQALTAAEQQDTALAPRIAATQKSLNHLQTELENQHKKNSALTEQIQTTRQQRAALIAEQDLTQLEHQQQQAIENARSQLTTAQTAQSMANEQLAALKATLHGMQQQITEATSNLQQATQRWHDWQQKLALAENQLSELLATDDSWINGERAALKQIEQAVDAAGATAKARQHDLLAQEALALTAQRWLAEHEIDEGAEQQAQQAADWQQQKETLDEKIFQHRQQLSADAQAKTKAGALTQQLESQQARYELWEQMNELIGSANGSKFRSLAQSLTLQQLVILANEHLQELAPRYALQPVPGSGLALQVIDHEMGDEVRSVESLSGGESFLVSLALALALASLATDTQQLDSLFIDEGFGTLDPDSLEMALACLDALQADGRQIGVISHVSTLVERIGVQVKVEAMGGGRSRVVVGD